MSNSKNQSADGKGKAIHSPQEQSIWNAPYNCLGLERKTLVTVVP